MKNNLQFLIESNNINITHMSKELKVSRGSIYRVLNGGVPSAELLLKISTYFKKDARDIFFIPDVRQVAHRN
ncbi:helix-turn-helix transcriptional regulator [Paenibacillus sp. LjRoot56]|uniref:helix-turn-helix transcriptional regulator n=1 Tax=Paenibacillus sp. LjRoot56 TaxID=3342333 RepID=UPI003ECCFB65